MTAKPYSLRVVQAVNYDNDSRWNYPFNLYPFHTLYLVKEGDGCVRIGETVTELRPGHAYLLPAYTLYTCWCRTRIRKMYIEFFLDSPSGAHVFFEQGQVLCRALPPEQFNRALSLKAGGGLMDSMRLEGELLLILSLFVSDLPLRSAPDLSRFQPLLADIRANLACDMKLSQLAMKHGFSPSALSQAFRRALHCTPKQYAQHLLANVLKNQLLHTDKSIAQLAEEYRFCDAYYLSNFFKRHMGLSPQAYRRTIQSGGERGERVVP